MSLTEIGLRHYLVVSALLFALGMAVIIVKRNGVAVLVGIELVLNAAALNFVAFASFAAPGPGGGIDTAGQVVTIFIIMIAAAEAAVALAIVLNIFQHFKSIDVDQVDSLRE